ncbi:MAG: hypothetical protein ILP10_05610 [Lachnospiraceae bacterium]|nr:hypothetical protein [Lachnospiraceae bacterium]
MRVLLACVCVFCLFLAGCSKASGDGEGKPGADEIATPDVVEEPVSDNEDPGKGEGMVPPIVELSGLGELKEKLGIDLKESDLFKNATYIMINGYMGSIDLTLKDPFGNDAEFSFRCVKKDVYDEKVKGEDAEVIPGAAGDASEGTDDPEVAHLQMLHGIYDEDMSSEVLDEGINLRRIKALTEKMNIYCWSDDDELFCLTCESDVNATRELEALVGLIDVSGVDGERGDLEPFASMPEELVLEKVSTEWKTTVKLSGNGSFEGSFSSFDPSNADAKSYPSGTMYVCDFKGRFGEAEQVSEGVYATRVARLLQEGEEGEETGEEGMRIVTAYPCGLENGEHIVIYAPGTKTADLSDSFLLWLYEYLSREEARAAGAAYFEGGDDVGAGEAKDGSKLDISKLKEDLPETLPCWALYNKDMDEAFFGE